MMHVMALLFSVSGGGRFIILEAVMLVYVACMLRRGQSDASVMSE